jgi:hypothetical protein
MLSCIRSLKKNKDAALFLEPVNPVLFGIPHYPDIIKNPMDLGTVETKLIVSDPRGPPKDKSKMGKWDQSKGKYNSVADVSLDVRQIFWNTARFNGMDHVVTQAATRLDAVFAKMIANIPAEVSQHCWGVWTELIHSPLLLLPHPLQQLVRLRMLDVLLFPNLPSFVGPRTLPTDPSEKSILPHQKIWLMPTHLENPNDETTLNSNGLSKLSKYSNLPTRHMIWSCHSSTLSISS